MKVYYFYLTCLALVVGACAGDSESVEGASESVANGKATSKATSQAQQESDLPQPLLYMSMTPDEPCSLNGCTSTTADFFPLICNSNGCFRQHSEIIANVQWYDSLGGDPNFVTTPWGDGVQFLGHKTGNEARLEITHEESVFDLGNDFTISAWVKLDEVTGRQTIMNKWYAKDSYNLQIDGSHASFRIAMPGGDWGNQWNVDSDKQLEAGQWYFIAGTVDVSSICVDIIDSSGTPIDHKCEGILGIIEVQNSDRPLVFGNHPVWDALKGTLDQVRIFDQALSEEEVKQVALLDAMAAQ